MQKEGRRGVYLGYIVRTSFVQSAFLDVLLKSRVIRGEDESGQDWGTEVGTKRERRVYEKWGGGKEVVDKEGRVDPW